MPPKRRRRFQGLYYHSSPPKVIPMNDQLSNGRRRREVDDFSIKLSTIRIWMHEKDIGKLTRILWAGQGNRLRQQASTNPRVKRFLAAVPYVMNAIKDVHQAVIDNNLETLQAKLEPPVPPALITGKDANGLNIIHKAAGLGHTKMLEYLISAWPEGANEADITGKTALHWAASAKNNMRCYTLLTQAGCDEEALDYKSKTPSYYRHKPQEIERAFLVYVPDAPRVSPDVITDWDALSEDNNNDTKKSDIKMLLTNGVHGRLKENNIESSSEVDLNDGVSANDEEEVSKEENGNELSHEPEENGNTSVADAVEDNATENEKIPDSPEEEYEKEAENEVEVEEDAEDEKNAYTFSEASVGDVEPVENGEESIEVENETNEADETIEACEVKMNGEVEVHEEEISNNQEHTINENENDSGEGDDEINEQFEDGENNQHEDIHNEIDKNDEAVDNIEENAEEVESYEKDNDELETDKNNNREIDGKENGVAEEKIDNNEESNIVESPKEDTENFADDVDENESANKPEPAIGTEKTIESDRLSEMFEKVNGELETEDEETEEQESNDSADDIPNHLQEEYEILKANKVIQKDEETGEKICTEKPLEANEDNLSEDENKSNNKDFNEQKHNGDKSDKSDENDDDEDVIVPPPSAGTSNLTHQTSTTTSNQEDEANVNNENNTEGDADDVDDIEIRSGKKNSSKSADSPTSSLAIEGFVHGESEDNTVQSQSAALIDEEARIQQVIASGDMEQLAQIVLNGDGSKLLDMQSPETDIQAFLNNVPNYMSKIRRVHEAARDGSLLSLQQALDRRKFAIAKDEISPNGATPLHVAVLFGHSDIVRYLAARFPETTTVTDNDGRTALHYAAVIKDNGHFYNMLSQLGANPKTKDKNGHTSEFLMNSENAADVLTYRQLLSNFGAEDLEAEILNDQGEAENHSFQSNPIFKTEQGKYLASTLADPLIEALTEIANKRPDDPVSYLTSYLQKYVGTRNLKTGGSSSKTSSTKQTNRMNGNLRSTTSQDNDINDIEVDETDESVTPQSDDRDEHGQSMLHFACARSHRRGGLMHLIEESSIDITYRDELYRTARDVSLQANQPGNAREIDRYVLSLAVVGDVRPFQYFAISGYDHIIDVTDNNDKNIIEIADERNHEELAAFLRTLRSLEELREELHQMIRENNVERVKEIANSSDGKWLLKAKNYYGRTALHIAVLKESDEIVEYFLELHPEVVKIGDNLERLPLHYAMGTNNIESLSRVLINKGAKRTAKDLKGRQPSYYFMNKADILRLQEEEEETR